MKNKVKSITEKIPQITTLPDGFYTGIWSGNIIELKYNGITYELTTEVYVKGINIRVVIEVKDGITTFDILNDVLNVDAKKNNSHLFDINQTGFYEYDKPELKERTKQRLTEIAECGMEVVGYGQFGYKGIMSGLYIEKVWSYSDKDFKDYMDWAKNLIQNKSI